MSAAPSLRKGWCPGALRPMAARDGLLVRVRPAGGILPAATAGALADCAERWGNGLFDLTARANLQMRGVREAALPALLDALRALDLLDADAAGEAVRNVIASPLDGLGGGPDLRPAVAALEARLTGDAALHALPGKFGFLVDDGGAPTLAAVAADVRFDWCPARGSFAVALGGTRADALPVGTCLVAELPARAATIATGFLRLARAYPEARRMRALRAAAGDAAVVAACGGSLATFAPAERRTSAPEVVGPRRFGTVPVLGLAAPFGRLNSTMLRAAAHPPLPQAGEWDRAQHGGGGLPDAVTSAPSTAFGGAPPPRFAQGRISELRLTPWRTILLPYRPDASARSAATAGWIVDPTDPRLRIAACTGRDGCERGTTDTYAEAAALAPLVPVTEPGVVLHVSGCAKGCAKASATTITLVGRDGRYDLVRHGRAGDPPERCGLALADLRDALAATPILEPA